MDFRIQISCTHYRTDVPIRIRIKRLRTQHDRQNVFGNLLCSKYDRKAPLTEYLFISTIYCCLAKRCQKFDSSLVRKAYVNNNLGIFSSPLYIYWSLIFALKTLSIITLNICSIMFAIFERHPSIFRNFVVRARKDQ